MTEARRIRAGRRRWRVWIATIVTVACVVVTPLTFRFPTTTAPPQSSGGGGSAGSAAVGSTSYPVPLGALFVAPSGSDNAAGTQAAPLRTVAKAVLKSSSGSTVVLRAGTY